MLDVLKPKWPQIGTLNFTIIDEQTSEMDINIFDPRQLQRIYIYIPCLRSMCATHDSPLLQTGQPHSAWKIETSTPTVGVPRHTCPRIRKNACPTTLTAAHIPLIKQE